MTQLFLTGSSSFVGRELIGACARRGIAVSGIDLATPERSGFHAADLRDPAIATLIPEGVDAVVHLGALSRDPDCRNNAARCFDVNVMGSLNVTAAAQARGAKQVIFASSEWVYDRFVGDAEKTEDDPIDALALTSEYALSKLVAEANLRQKAHHGFCATTILRFGIIYGPRTANWSAFEAMVNAVATQDEVKIGSRKTARRFIHVTDIAEAVLAALGRTGTETFNIQGPVLLELGAIIDEAMRQTGRNPRVVETAPAAPNRRPVSAEKAARALGWRARIGLVEGVASVLPSILKAAA